MTLIKANQPYFIESADGKKEEIVVMSFFRTKCSSPHISYIIYRSNMPDEKTFEWVGFSHNAGNTNFCAIRTLINKISGVSTEHYNPVQVNIINLHTTFFD
jgi:hypothetical protein